MKTKLNKRETVEQTTQTFHVQGKRVPVGLLSLLFLAANTHCQEKNRRLSQMTLQAEVIIKPFPVKKPRQVIRPNRWNQIETNAMSRLDLAVEKPFLKGKRLEDVLKRVDPI